MKSIAKSERLAAEASKGSGDEIVMYQSDEVMCQEILVVGNCWRLICRL